MTKSTIDNHAGLEIIDPGFRKPARLLLEALFALSPGKRESLLFSSSPMCPALQKVMQRSLGGVWTIVGKFTNGILTGYHFECYSNEKYFMLGAAFEPDVQDVLRSLTQPGGVAYDVGSHVGYMALLLSALLGPSGKVVTFEPSPVNYQRVRRNLVLNPQANVTLVHRAASNVEGSAVIREAGSQSTIGEPGPDCSDSVSAIQTIRLDDFVYRDGNPEPTFLKIDVEGHAGQCLEGMRKILRKRPAMILEIHDSKEAASVDAILNEFSYKISDIDAPGQFPRRISATAEMRNVN